MKVVPRVPRPLRAICALGLISVCATACTGGTPVGTPGGLDPSVGGLGQTGGSANAAGGSGATGGTGKPDLSNGGPKLRVLTQAEYKSSLTYVLQDSVK